MLLRIIRCRSRTGRPATWEPSDHKLSWRYAHALSIFHELSASTLKTDGICHDWLKGWPRVASKCANPPTFACFAASLFQDMRPAGTSTPMALSIMISSAFSPSFRILFALRRISYEVLKSGFGPEYTQFAWGRYGSARRCNHLLRLAEFFIELHGSPFFACGVVVVHSRI